MRGALGDLVTLAVELLPRHVAILAGPGSGKTVLLRRIVEEAALLGIPSIVLDINNDLARLGDRWPARPDGFSDDDEAKTVAYHNRADVVIWTPGVRSGNPVSLNLLPNFAAIGEDPDEREQAVEMARATISRRSRPEGASQTGPPRRRPPDVREWRRWHTRRFDWLPVESSRKC
ncbi:MAG: helicase HerA domain-containing protein [Methylocella sp.]